MELIAKADVVLALGTRLNPFSTLPGYGIDYWPKDAKLIQVDINADRIGLTKPVTVGIQGDAKKVAEALTEKVSDNRSKDREDLVSKTSPHGSRRYPPWITRMMIQAPTGTSAPAKPSEMVEPAHGVACCSGKSAKRRDHLFRHRQQLRHRQRLPDV